MSSSVMTMTMMECLFSGECRRVGDDSVGIASSKLVSSCLGCEAVFLVGRRRWSRWRLINNNIR